MLSRIRSDIFVKLLVSLIIAVIIAILPNYQYFVYHGIEELTDADIESQGVANCIGYRVKSDNCKASTIKEINDLQYCTITLKRSDLQSTGYYRILDETKAGVEYGNDRNSFDTKHDTFVQGKVSTFLLNNWGPQYGQFYVATLESGEKIVVLLDQTVLESGKSKTLTLPLGEVVTTYPDVIFSEIDSKYSLSEEGKTWYLDMAGANFVNSVQMNTLHSIRIGIGVAVFIILYIIATVIFKKLKWV